MSSEILYLSIPQVLTNKGDGNCTCQNGNQENMFNKEKLKVPQGYLDYY